MQHCRDEKQRTLTIDRLRQVLHYDKASGVFTWAVRTAQKIQIGDVAGTVVTVKKTGKKYRVIRIDTVNHKAHRLAVFYETGTYPVGEIDHRDGDGLNNKLLNLREVSKSVNMQNIRKARANNKCGLLGVHVVPNARRKHQASIRADGKSRYLGLHETAEEAHQAYLAAKRELHEGNTL